MESLWQDVRHSIVMLSKRRGFTVIALLILALGIGATTAIFSVVNGVLLRPLTYPESDKLVRVFEKVDRTAMASDRMEVAPANFLDWQKRNQSFTEIAAYGTGKEVLVSGGEPEQVTAGYVSANLFPVLGASAMLGRTFNTDEDRPGSDDVVLLGYGLWQRRFGGNPDVVGQTISLDGHPFTVIGVMPAGFEYPSGTTVWTPLALRPNQIEQREAHWLKVVARIKPDITIEQARAEMDLIAHNLEKQHPATNEGWGATVIPLLDNEVGQVRLSLLILLGAVALVLLIACVNIASLLLARAATRQTEIAIRLTLGATRWRIIRQLLIESLMLAFLGGVAGCLLVLWGVDALAALAPEELPRIGEIRVDGRVLGFALFVSLATGVLFGLIPALQSSKPDLIAALKEGGGNRASGKSARTLNALVVVEVALALVVLISAGLLMRSFLQLQNVDTGTQPGNVLTMEINLPSARYGGTDSREQRLGFYRQLIEQVEAVPGVESAGAVDSVPLAGSGRVWRLRKDGHAPEGLAAGFQVVTTNYFRSIGMSLRRGRLFIEADGEGASPVVVINETMAQRFWPGEDVLGQRIIIRNEESARQVIGVVNDVRHFGLDKPAEPEMYVPYNQFVIGAVPLVVRSSVDPGALIEAIKDRVRAIDPGVAVAKIRTMNEVISGSLARRRFAVILLSIFAVVALVLAAVGIYGVISYAVAQRTREIGIRMALGATHAAVLGLVMGRATKLIVTGIICGLIASLALMRVVSNLLFGVSAADPTTFAVIALLLAGIGLLASYIPARRAIKIDPMIALRYE